MFDIMSVISGFGSSMMGAGIDAVVGKVTDKLTGAKDDFLNFEGEGETKNAFFNLDDELDLAQTGETIKPIVRLEKHDTIIDVEKDVMPLFDAEPLLTNDVIVETGEKTRGAVMEKVLKGDEVGIEDFLEI